MATINLSIPELAGQSPVTADIYDSQRESLIESNVALTEGSTGEFSGTTVDDMKGVYYFAYIKVSGVIASRVVFRQQPAPPTHNSQHMPNGTDGQVLMHNGTEFLATNQEVLTNLAKSDIQGYYGLLTNFYFVGGVPTVTEIDTDEVDQWIDVNFDVDALGTFDYRPDPMKTARAIGHSGAGTQADPIEFSLEGLTLSSSANFRASMTFEPDVDEAQLETRLIFTRHSGTIPDTQFPIADVSLIMNNGADIEYDAEPMLSFFVGDTIDTNGPGDAGSCRFQIRSSVEGTLRMRALTWYIQS